MNFRALDVELQAVSRPEAKTDDPISRSDKHNEHANTREILIRTTGRKARR